MTLGIVYYAADRFHATGVRHFEPEVRPTERFLMERFVQASAVIVGEYEEEGDLKVFHNPKIKPGTQVPKPRVASIDIETGVTVDMLFSIAIHITGPAPDGTEEEIKRVYMLSDRHAEVPEENLIYYASQADLLKAFLADFRAWDPDVIIGWHVVGFDLMYLERKCNAFGMELDLARGGRKISLTERPGAGYFADIPGRIVIDGPPSMRAAGFRFENFKLETVAQELLGSGKLITSDGTNKVAEIERQFREDKPALARYNLEDCVLVTDIYNLTGLVDFVLKRSMVSGLLPDTSLIAKAAFDHHYLPRLHRLGYVAPREPAERDNAKAATERPLDARPGVYEQVVHLDLSNLYFSMLRNFCIDPLARVKAEEDPIVTPDGQKFSRKHHVLPEILKRQMDWLAVAETKKDAQMVKACRLTLKSFLTVLTRKGSRFFEPTLADAMKACGQWFLRESQQFLEGRGYRVVFVDTRSFLIQAPDGQSATEAGPRLVEELNRFGMERLQRDFQIQAELSLGFECAYRKLALISDVSQASRYVGLRESENGEHLEVEGLALSGSDWTPLAREFQHELFTRFLKDDAFEPYVKGFYDDLREGKFDDRLVYRKKLVKDLDSYTKNVPPHVKAARMMSHHPGRYVDFVYSRRGPVPAEPLPSDLDYEHYANKQLKPVADPLLGLLDLSFSAITEPTQMGLF